MKRVIPQQKIGVYGQKKERKAEKARTTNISYKMESHFPPVRYVPVFYTIKKEKRTKNKSKGREHAVYLNKSSLLGS